MTKKSIENMARYIAVSMESCQESGNNERFTAVMKDFEKLFQLLFNCYAIPEYKNVEKLRQEVFNLAMDMYDKNNREVKAV